MRRNALWTGGIVASILAVMVLTALVDRSTVRSGPAGSSFVTTPEGSAGLYELLTARGLEVARLRRPDADLTDVGTLVVIEPGLAGYAPAEVAAIRRFVSSGGRLVVGGRMPNELEEALDVGGVERRLASAAGASIDLPIGGVGGTINLGGTGSFTDAGPNLPLTSSPVAAVVAAAGDGTVVHVADSAAFFNENLPQNGPFLVAITGKGPVWFDEIRHGYGIDGTGGIFSALPANVRHVLLLAIIPLFLGILSYGRRLGRPLPSGAAPGPERVEFAEAVGSILVRTRDPIGATEAARAAALRLITEGSQLTEEEREAVEQGPDDLESILTVDRALAKLWKEKP